jgi:hypothetical protein
MESTNPKENNSDKNKTPSNVPVKDEKKIIMSHIVQKSIRCSKATIDLTTRVIENLLSQDREKIIFLCENGLPDDLPELRSLIWKINLEYLPMNTEEWDKTLKSKRLAYQQYKNYVFKKLEEELKLFDGYDKLSRNEKAELDKKTHKGILEEICKDTNRTHTEMSFFFKPIDKNNTFTEEEIIKLVENKRNCTLRNINDTYKINIVMTHSDIVSRILFIYSKFEPIISYVQGMNEILAPIYYCFSFDRISDDQTMDDIEADTFWCFYNLMSHLKVLFDKNEDKKDDGINGKVNRLKNMLKVIDKQLYEHLDNSGFDFSVLAFRWISLMFSQDFFMIDLLRIWDFLLSSDNKYQNCYYFSLSIILMRKDFIMKNNIYKIYENFQNLKDLDVDNIIFNAKYIKNKCHKKCLEIMRE